MFAADPQHRGRRAVLAGWDVLMLNARSQAENYVRLLPKSHEPPPFVIVCDVGHCFEVYANFRRDGKAYDQFPDRQVVPRLSRRPARAEDCASGLLRSGRDPMSLDPARRVGARHPRDRRSGSPPSRRRWKRKRHPAEDVAMFLMRCLFTMFAEDVELLPEKSFKHVLERCEADAGHISA